jgi:hypothetical protein
MQPDLFQKPKPLILTVSGPIPSFKNNKILIAKGPSGRPLERPLMITKPEFQKVMAKMVDSFVSQLQCAFQTGDGATLTGCSLRSAIALSVPADDCLTQVPEIHIRAEMVEKGREGATIVIERL